jgi:hypothetical protein
MRCNISLTPPDTSLSVCLCACTLPLRRTTPALCCAARLGWAATVGRHHCRRALRPIASLPSRNKQSACCSVHSVSACIHPDCIELKWMNASRKEGGVTRVLVPRPHSSASQQCASVPSPVHALCALGLCIILVLVLVLGHCCVLVVRRGARALN